MKMEKEVFIKLLIDKAKENNININGKQAEKMYQYKELLIEWNEKINLTAITDDKDIIVKHFVDSLLCVEYINEKESIIDVGTGAGFPGIIIAIYFEGKVNITLLDALQKRVKFLNTIIESLKLTNIKVVHSRAEELAHKEEYREVYDTAIARAVAPLNILLEYLSGYTKVGGKCICLKSLSVDEEINSSKKASEILNVELEKNIKKIVKHKEDLTRTILIFNKIKNISSKYPRSFGKIKKSPL